MPVTLIVGAANWKSDAVKCTFVVKAKGVILVAIDPGKQIFELPPGTTEAEVTATPISPTSGGRARYWEQTISLTVASSGAIAPKSGSAPRTMVMQATGATRGLAVAIVRVNRFKEMQKEVLAALKEPVPGEPGKDRGGLAPTQPELEATYGKWPPDDLDIHRLSTAHYLDGANPVKPGGGLAFKQDDVNVESESVMLEVAGVNGTRLFGVVWPKAVVRKDNAAPTPFFLYIRQTGGQDRPHVMMGPYPYSFDYAERCLFESQHYSTTPLYVRKGWMLRPKGVPYQVARSGAKVVSVFPVAYSVDEYGYVALASFDALGDMLGELQAFMYWKAGIAIPPSTVGSTALSAFSSANDLLASWLMTNDASTFLKNNIRAVYFLDPPRVRSAVTAGLHLREKFPDKRVRLYSAIDDDRFVSDYTRLLGRKAKDGPLPPPPFVLGAADNKITMARFPTKSWKQTFLDVVAFDWTNMTYWDAHHFVPAMTITHALSDHLVAGRDL